MSFLPVLALLRSGSAWLRLGWWVDQCGGSHGSLHGCPGPPPEQESPSDGKAGGKFCEGSGVSPTRQDPGTGELSVFLSREGCLSCILHLKVQNCFSLGRFLRLQTRLPLAALLQKEVTAPWPVNSRGRRRWCRPPWPPQPLGLSLCWVQATAAARSLSGALSDKLS